MTKEIPFKHFGVMLDCSRNGVMKPQVVKTTIDYLSQMGYNTLMLYTEDTYEVDNQPYFGHLRGRYSQKELMEIDAYARSKGIELIPCIQTLAHLNAIMRWPQYRDMSDCDDILCVEDERVYRLLEDIFATLERCFTSRTVNIGMDEAYMLGLGRYRERNGYPDRTEIFLSQLNKVAAIGKKYGFTLDTPVKDFSPEALDALLYGTKGERLKLYRANEFEGNFEIVSLSGTIDRMNGAFYAHLHMSAGNEKGEVFGGHLNRAVVSATCEMTVTLIDGEVDRRFDEEVGLNLWKF